VTITGPHGIKEGRPFYFIFEAKEATILGCIVQYCFWRTKGWELFGSSLDGFLIAWRITWLERVNDIFLSGLIERKGK
jgi:hypothetical protein